MLSCERLGSVFIFGGVIIIRTVVVITGRSVSMISTNQRRRCVIVDNMRSRLEFLEVVVLEWEDLFFSRSCKWIVFILIFVK
jgi:hypothetical protein